MSSIFDKLAAQALYGALEKQGNFPIVPKGGPMGGPIMARTPAGGALVPVSGRSRLGALLRNKKLMLGLGGAGVAGLGAAGYAASGGSGEPADESGSMFAPVPVPGAGGSTVPTEESVTADVPFYKNPKYMLPAGLALGGLGLLGTGAYMAGRKKKKRSRDDDE